MMDLCEKIEAAYQRIKPHTLQTPLLHSHWLSDYCGGEVLLKLESEQHTGSFKARGSLNKLLWLQEHKAGATIVTASTGNHGLGVARGLAITGLKGTIFLPKNAAPAKVEAIKAYGGSVEFYGTNPYDTEMHARTMADRQGSVYISPYNDAHIIAGQGTIGVELSRQVDHTDQLIATVGGGGLISGIGSWVARNWPNTTIIGSQPANSPEMAASVRAGAYQEIESKPTLSDGSAGGFERDAITFDYCKKLVHSFTLINEEAIKEAIIGMLRHHHKVIEGAAGVALAAILKNPEAYKNKRTVCIICGANIGLDSLREVLTQAD